MTEEKDAIFPYKRVDGKVYVLRRNGFKLKWKLSVTKAKRKMATLREKWYGG